MDDSLIRVLVIEDRPIFAAAIRRQLADCSTVLYQMTVVPGVGGVGQGTSAKYDIVVLRDGLPDCKGIVQCLGSLRSICRAGIPIVVLTPGASQRHVNWARAMGATVLPENVKAPVLARTIENLVRDSLDLDGHPHVLMSVASREVIEIATDALRSRSLIASILTRSERGILRRVRPPVIKSDLAADLGISVRTVEGHLDSLRNKIGVRSNDLIYVRAIEIGLIDPRSDIAGLPRADRRRQ